VPTGSNSEPGKTGNTQIRSGRLAQHGRAPALQAGCHRFKSFTAHHSKTNLRGRSSVRLERWPVKPEVAGSSPVVPASFYNEIPEDFIDKSIFTYEGQPIGSVRKAFKAACRRAGIKNLRFHDLRHTFATRLVLSGVDLATVSKLLGHSSIQMTMRYSHPTPEALKNAVSKLDK